ncbi:hypothetical protein B0H10DRAFT_2244044 [Mycena sp. CBHHK59/15]|nr:hypothetical protein B0H10DRAFT_2244044 [Mycena sp. CBHHK59/15]
MVADTLTKALPSTKAKHFATALGLFRFEGGLEWQTDVCRHLLMRTFMDIISKSDTSGQMGRTSQQTRHNFRKSDTHNQLVSLHTRESTAWHRAKYLPPSLFRTTTIPQSPPLPPLKYDRETIPRRKKTRWKATGKGPRAQALEPGAGTGENLSLRYFLTPIENPTQDAVRGCEDDGFGVRPELQGG